MEETIALGKSELHVPPLGLGTWQWGDKRMWQYGKGFSRSEVEAAYRVSREAGLTFFDTAEIYGNGLSETILGGLVQTERSRVVVASKFAPLPWRLSARTLPRALNASLKRLGLAQVDLYQIHWPYSALRIEALMDALAEQVQAGTVRAVGVSNYRAREVRRAHAALAKHGIPLASNQVQYSLLHRAPERNGVLATCRELDVRLIAYSPIAKGALSGKYHDAAPVTGARRGNRWFQATGLAASQPLVALLRQIGEQHGDKTPVQVALNWLIKQGALPIPGAKNAAQASSNAGALGWELSEQEFAQISMLRVAGA